MKSKFLLALALAFFSNQASALDQDFQQWSMIVLQGNVTENWRGYLEIQPRWSGDTPSQDRLIIRPAAVYTLSSEVSLWAGYAAIETFSPSISWENRGWQQIQYEKNFGGIILINRTRFEERFLATENDVSFRLREMVRTLIPFSDDKTWAIVFSDEIFINLNTVSATNQAGFDQNRAFAGINYMFNPSIRFEAGYMNNFVNLPENLPDRMNHIFLFSTTFNF